MFVHWRFGDDWMAQKSEPVFDAEVPVCPRCLKPQPLCVCDEIQPIANRITLLILQHPQEQDRLLGTARLAAQQFAQATLRVGLSWPSLAKALGPMKGSFAQFHGRRRGLDPPESPTA
jgi:hypothetical protein